MAASWLYTLASIRRQKNPGANILPKLASICISSTFIPHRILPSPHFTPSARAYLSPGHAHFSTQAPSSPPHPQLSPKRRPPKVHHSSTSEIVDPEGRVHRFATVIIRETSSSKWYESVLHSWEYACSLVGEGGSPSLTVAFSSVKHPQISLAIEHIAAHTDSYPSRAKEASNSSALDKKAPEPIPAVIGCLAGAWESELDFSPYAARVNMWQKLNNELRPVGSLSPIHSDQHEQWYRSRGSLSVDHVEDDRRQLPPQEWMQMMVNKTAGEESVDDSRDDEYDEQSGHMSGGEDITSDMLEYLGEDIQGFEEDEDDDELDDYVEQEDTTMEGDLETKRLPSSMMSETSESRTSEESSELSTSGRQRVPRRGRWKQRRLRDVVDGGRREGRSQGSISVELQVMKDEKERERTGEEDEDDDDEEEEDGPAPPVKCRLMVTIKPGGQGVTRRKRQRGKSVVCRRVVGGRLGRGNRGSMRGASRGFRYPMLTVGEGGQVAENEVRVDVGGSRRKVGNSEGRVMEKGESKEKGGSLFPAQVVLCVAQLAGAKVTGFIAPDSSVPELPELEDAVVDNNPHMLVLGLPGFNFPDFYERMEIVFPESVRAGVFLMPVPGLMSVRELSQLCKAAGPLTCGGKEYTSGAVGLAISSDGTGGPIPLTVFSELVRMSLGNTRFFGAAVFDEPICAELFFPKTHSSSSKAMPPISKLLSLGTHTCPAKRADLDTLGEGFKVIESEEEGQTSSEVLLEKPVALALFDTALFPGCSLDFHMFEPRYRVMVKNCLDSDEFFGIAHVMRAAPEREGEGEEDEGMYGTLASVDVKSFEDDGRSDVMTEGLCRFRVVGKVGPVLPHTFGLHSAKVALIFDDPIETDDVRQDLETVVEYVSDRCRESLHKFPQPGASQALLDTINTDEPVSASFSIAQIVASHRSIPMEMKIGWLKMRDTKSRLLELLEQLDLIDGTAAN